MEWKADILFPNEAQCPPSSERELPRAAWSWRTRAGLLPLSAAFLLLPLSLGETRWSQRRVLAASQAPRAQPRRARWSRAPATGVGTEVCEWQHTLAGRFSAV